jgi:hypothetical protein
MELSDQERHGLGIALNEADLLGIAIDTAKRLAVATFRVLTLPESGPVPDDRRVQMRFSPVGRIAASLRDGPWDDPHAAVVPFEVTKLPEVVQSFGGLAISGWEFFDIHEPALEQWGGRLSLDWRSDDAGLAHSICLYQDAGTRILDFCLWFDRLEIRAQGVTPIPLGEFIDGGKRWWHALYAGDPRAADFGIVPLKT